MWQIGIDASKDPGISQDKLFPGVFILLVRLVCECVDILLRLLFTTSTEYPWLWPSTADDSVS